MSISTTIRTAAVLCAAGLLFAGCAGTTTQVTPSQTTSSQTPPLVRGTATHRTAAPGRAWISPAAKKGDLLYVSYAGNDQVAMYSYPKLKPVGSIPNLQWPEGMCTDSVGNVWITNFELYGYLPGYMTEYKHGGTKAVATLQDGEQSPGDCSVDPTTGNLAIANRFPAQGTYTSGNIGIYMGAKGTPVTYTTPDLFFYYWCTYDDKGNLFVSGFSKASQVVVAELPKGATKFKTLQLDESLTWPVGIRWDGKYLAIGDGDEDNPVVYQFKVQGKKATTANSLRLGGASSIAQFTIFDGSIIVPSVVNGTVGVYEYPAGGDPKKSFTPGNEPVGTVVSTVK